jgi:flagellar basal body-associated protein FliL
MGKLKKSVKEDKQLRNSKLISLSVLVIVLSLSFVFGYVVYVQNVITDQVFPTINRSVYQVYNITINNTLFAAAENITAVNITIPKCFAPIGIGATAGINESFSNATNATNDVMSWGNTSLNGLIPIRADYNSSFWFNASANCVGNQTITVTVWNTTTSTYYNLYVLVNDLTNISYDTLTPVDNYNSSSKSLYVNASLPMRDLRGNITFLLEYSNGTEVNKTIYDVQQRIDFINWTGKGTSTALIDGDYKYNITVNDSYGNTTTTATRTFTVDNTAPTITYNCSSNDVNMEDPISCQCTASDTLDGGPTMNYEGNPSTDVEGTFTTTCTATDHTSNVATENYEYTVNYGGSSPVDGGSGGGTSYTNTYVENTKDFSEVKEITKQLKTNERVRIKIVNTNHDIGITGLTATTATVEITSTPQIATLNVGDTRKFDITEDGYYDLSVTLNKIESSKADITITSVYEKVTEETAKTEEEEQREAIAQREQEEEEAAAAKKRTWMWIIIGVIVVLVVLIGVGYGVKKKK